MPVIDTLITDRTRSDVDELLEQLTAGTNPSLDHKGAYNFSDLNRVGQAANYILDRLQTIGFADREISFKTNWTATDFPRLGQMESYLSGIKHIRSELINYQPGVDLPDSMRYLDYIGANEIESLLIAAEDIITKIILSYRGYSGRLTAGVNCLP